MSNQKWVEDLWASIQRASDSFTGEGTLTEEEGILSVGLELGEKIPPQVKPLLKRYIKMFGKEEGWDVKGVKIDNGYLLFTASKRESSSRKKKSHKDSGSK